jgi:hypothetical protein
MISFFWINSASDPAWPITAENVFKGPMVVVFKHVKSIYLAMPRVCPLGLWRTLEYQSCRNQDLSVSLRMSV